MDDQASLLTEMSSKIEQLTQMVELLSVKKKRGRPLGSKDSPSVKEKSTKPRGRPRKQQAEEVKPEKKVRMTKQEYNRRYEAKKKTELQILRDLVKEHNITYTV